jgi:hypothetical protein
LSISENILFYKNWFQKDLSFFISNLGIIGLVFVEYQIQIKFNIFFNSLTSLANYVLTLLLVVSNNPSIVQNFLSNKEWAQSDIEKF